MAQPRPTPERQEIERRLADLNARLATATSRLQALLAAAEEISSRLDLREMLRKIVEQAANITGATQGLAALREDERVVMREWWDGRSWQPFEFAWEKGEGCSGLVFLTRKPYVSADARSDPHALPQMLRLMKLKTFVMVPMLSRNGEFLGLIEVGNKAGDGSFSDDDVEMVTAFSRLAAVAFQNRKLLVHLEEAGKQAEARARREKAIGEVALAVNSGAGIRDVLWTAIARMTEALGAGIGAIFLLDPTGRRLRGVATTAEIGGPIEAAEIDLKRTAITRRAFRRKQPILATMEKAHPSAQSLLAEIGAQQFLAIPLLAAGNPIGIAYLIYEKIREQLTSEEMDFAISLASQCAIAIDKARLLEEARTQRQRLESIVEQMPGGVAIGAAPENRIELLNRWVRDTSGKALRVGMPVTAVPETVGVYHADGRPFQPEELPLYRALVFGEAVLGIEQVVRRPNRKPRWLLSRAVPLLDERGQIREAVAVIEDITSLKEAQQRAEESARLARQQKVELEAIVDNLAEGVFIADPSGRVLRTNRAGVKILGFKSAKDIFRRVEDYLAWDLCDPQGRALPMENWPISRAMRGEAFAEQEVVLTTADGQRRNLLVGGSAVRGPDGKPTMAVVVFRDITAIRDLERQREEFISVVAHDLRAALTVVKGGSQMLLRPEGREALPAESWKLVETIHSSGRRLDRMISDLLDVSRIEARRLKLEKRPLDLARLVQTVVDRSAELTKGHPVELAVRGPAPTIHADADRIEQILTNLLSNAAKYSYPDTPITVEVTPRQDDVMVSVTNLGVGIKPEDTVRLFTRFHRTGAAAGEKVPGLGLGLYISKGLVEAHGGRIWVESAPDEYATLRFTIPKAA